jgi:AcrR family transcriptional regulator/DNA-binding MarR family transcriptional regulator
MSAARSGSDRSPAGIVRRQVPPVHRGRSRAGAVQVAEFQRSRMLRAALAVASERGYAGLTATAVVDRAGVSRKTFYDLFEDRDDCFLALIDDGLAQLAACVIPAYQSERDWPERLRAALCELLAFAEREPEIWALVLSYMLGRGPQAAEPRAWLLELLQGVVAEGRLQVRSRRYELSPLAEEVVVGGALAVLDARLQAQPWRPHKLANELMWMIVLPFLGPAAAARELSSAVAPHPTTSPRANSFQVRLNMRLTQRTALVLEAIAAAPGASNVAISKRAGISDQGQISKLLGRLAGLGLIESKRPQQPSGIANAWHLTDAGAQLESAIRCKP